MQKRAGGSFSNLFGGYDDPAVAVCEFTKLRGRTPKPAEYSRVSSRIKGTEVEITHTSTPLNTPPQTHVYKCEFETSESGFTLKRSLGPKTQKCVEMAESYHAEIAAGVSSKRRNEIAAFAKSCDATIRQETADIMRAIMDEGVALTSAGLYPIKPETTRLSP